MKKRLFLMLVAGVITATGTVSGAGAQDGTAAPEPVTLTVMLSESSTVRIDPEAPAHEAITEKTGANIKWEAVPSSDYNQKIRTLIATNNVPDIALIGKNEYNDFGASGAFLEVDSIIDDMPNFRAVAAKNKWINKYRIDGKLYTFPTVSRDDVTKAPLMFGRMDLLRKHNLPVPTTFTELYQIMVALKKEYPDSIPYTCRGSGSLLNTLAYSMNTGRGIYYDVDVNGGSYVYAPTSDEYKTMLVLLNRMYTEGLLDPDYSVTSNQQWVEKNSSGKGLFSYDNPIYIVRMNKGLQAVQPDAEFGMIPVVRNADGTRRFKLYAVHPGRYWSVGAKTKHPVEIARLFNWLYSDEGCDIRSFGIEGVHYNRVGGNNVFKQELLDKYAAEGDAYTGMQSAIGIAYATFVPYYDNALLKATQIPELQKWWFEDIANDPDRDYSVIDPPFTPAQLERIRDIRSALSTLESESFDKFVMGAWPMSDFDKVVQQMRGLGSAELEGIYNTANAPYK